MARCYACRRFSPADGSPALRQLLLGASQDKQLCILPPSTSVSKNHRSSSLIDRRTDAHNKQYIAKIPDELLNGIFTHALQSDVGRTGVSYTALALSTVSRRFHRIVQPLMYSTLDLSEHSLARPCLPIKLFHRTLKENPILGPMVRSLYAHVEYLLPNTGSSADFAIGIEILNLLPNLEEFQIQGGYEYPSTWPMIKNAVANWKRINRLRLVREDFSLLMPPVCELIVATPSLTSLELHGVGEGRDNPSHVVWTPPSKEIERTSAITTLTIHDFSATPSALQNLLLLPRALSHFAFGKIHYSPVPWSLNQFQSLLAPHRDTLKSIEIGSLGAGYTPISFLQFSRLEVLQLSHWGYRATPEEAASSLLAPQLHTFIWDFRIIDQHTESWSDFSAPQQEWVLRFAELAKDRKSKLSRIEIVFCPDGFQSPRSREELAVCVSPWDLMDEVGEKIRPLGVELVYNKCWSREECLKRIEEDEKSLADSLEDGEDGNSLLCSDEGES